MPAVQALGSFLRGANHARQRKKSNPSADLPSSARELIRSSKVVTPARCDVDIKLNLMIAASDFWSTNYYEHPPLTDIAVARAERILGVRLPAELIALLRIQNGGYTKGFIHPMAQPTTWAKDHVPLHDLSGIIIDPNHSSPMNMVRTTEMTQEWELPPKQVLLSGDGHYWITLDYRIGASPSVAWIDVECGEDIQVAPSFGQFFASLVAEISKDEV